MENFEIPKSFNSVNALVDRIRALVSKFRMEVKIEETSIKVDGVVVHYFSNGKNGQTNLTPGLEAFLLSANENQTAPNATIRQDEETGVPTIVSLAA